MRFASFSKLPIRKKLIVLSVLIAGGALFIFTLISAFAQVRVMRQAMVDNLTILSESIADLSSAALSFSDQGGAEDILGTLHADPDIEVAAVFDADGTFFAAYFKGGNNNQDGFRQEIQADTHGFIFQDNSYKFQIFRSILVQDKTIGTLYLLSNSDRMVAHLINSAMLLMFSMIAVFVATVIVSTRLQGLITRPVSLLASTARKISEKGNYALRVEKSSDDEIGQLIDDFNTMLAGIQERDAELQEHRQNLEVLVADRTEELRAKRDEALAAALAKSEFLANMSHEIRTPMNGVIGVLSLLQDVPMTQEYRRLLETATRSADSLLLIINDILDFSKIDAGKIVFESIPFDLRELMEETSALFIDTVNLKDIDLTCFIPVDTPCFIQGDPTRLRQIVTNLLSNAVKFTEKGVVKIEVSVKKRNGAELELIFAVEDSGIGIAEEVTGTLFEKFTQADGSTTRKYGGTGLGLSVCKQLVEKQGGEIGVRSRLGFGATFWFTMPFEIHEDSCQVVPYGKLQGKKCLLVDSSVNNSRVIEHYLRYCDVEVEVYCDAQSCLSRLEEMHRGSEVVADALLINHHLNDIDGLQLAETVHRKYGERAPKMILLSSTTFVKAQLRQSGIRSTLIKPIRQLDLYNSLAHFVVREKEQFLKESSNDRKKIIPAGLYGSILLVDDEPINQKIAKAILQKCGLHTEIAVSGMEALKMTAEKDYSVVLMDIQMPEMSGYEATELIRKRESQNGTQRSVIIAMTANAMSSTRKRCFEAGMDDFFTKPIKPDVLAERLRPWLSTQPDMEMGTTTEVEHKTLSNGLLKSTRTTHGDNHQMWEFETALGFVGGDEGLFRELVELFLSRNDTLLAGIEKSINAGDAKALRDSGHAFKGAVSHFAAEPVRKLALQLEKMGKNGEMDGSQDVYEKLCEAASQLLQELREYLEKSSLSD